VIRSVPGMNMTIDEFANDVRLKLSDHLAPADVYFRGSFAAGRQDKYSDIDLQANVHCPLDGRFYASLEEYLTRIYGPALVRYDPDFKDNRKAQNVRFSFYHLPVFWRIDLTIESDKDAEIKHPSPFPEWATGTSTLMNVVWAVKYYRRGDPSAASRLMACACEKVGERPIAFSPHNALRFIDRICGRVDTDTVFAEKLAEDIRGKPGAAAEAAKPLR
jgi:hypothetical protein